MSGKHCGPSQGLLDLDAKIGSALDDLQNSSIGTGAAGIADSISGLKANLKSKTDGILEKIEAAVPEIPEPKASLQAQMTSFINNLDNPGAALQELEDIKENFGSNINIDEMLAKTGVDPEKMKSLSEEFKGLQEKAKLQNAVGSLADLAAGDLSAIKDLMGGLPSVTLPGFDAASIIDGICKDVPNAEIDADGNFVEKGTESKVASEDADPSIEKSETNDAPKPEKQAAPSDQLETSSNVILNPDTDIAQQIEKEFNEKCKKFQSEDPFNNQETIKVFKESLKLREEGNDFKDEAQKFVDLPGNRTKNFRKAADKYLEANKLSWKVDTMNLLNLLKQQIAEYERDLAKFENNLIAKEPPLPRISAEEIHDKTHFQYWNEIVDEIFALQPAGPNVPQAPIYIIGLRPIRLNQNPKLLEEVKRDLGIENAFSN